MSQFKAHYGGKCLLEKKAGRSNDVILHNKNKQCFSSVCDLCLRTLGCQTNWFGYNLPFSQVFGFDSNGALEYWAANKNYCMPMLLCSLFIVMAAEQGILELSFRL